jgi:hypothetical protein
LRVTGDRPQIYQIFIANLLTWKTAADGPVGDPLMSVNFTDCRKWEKEHSGFQSVSGVARCLLINMARGIYRARVKWRSPMAHAAIPRLHEPLPLDTAMLSNIALSLFLWNIALRIAGLLLAA